MNLIKHFNLGKTFVKILTGECKGELGYIDGYASYKHEEDFSGRVNHIVEAIVVSDKGMGIYELEDISYIPDLAVEMLIAKKI